MSILIPRCLAAFAAIAGCLLGQNPHSSDSETKSVIDSINGPTLYKAYCAVCHGIRGKGDGPMAPLLKTPPPDLTRIAHRNAGTFPSETVQKIISGAEPRAAGHGPREMPIWGPIFSQIAWDLDLGRVRVDNLTGYIEEIQTK